MLLNWFNVTINGNVMNLVFLPHIFINLTYLNKIHIVFFETHVDKFIKFIEIKLLQ
jgi:hypothetical protein